MRYDRKDSNEYDICNSYIYMNNNNIPIFLVALALYDTLLALNNIKRIDDDKHLLNSRFFFNLTREQRTLLGLILDMVKDDNNKKEKSD